MSFRSRTVPKESEAMSLDRSPQQKIGRLKRLID